MRDDKSTLYDLIWPELGHFALILALVFAIFQTLIPAWGVFRQQSYWQAYAKPLCLGQTSALLLSFIWLALCFLTDEFSVAYVANHSNSLMPWYYKVSAVWGGHEGSLLLWIVILAGWSQAVAVKSKVLPLDMMARVLSVMGAISVGFLLFLLNTSNPFERILPSIPRDGSDLNPLLQDLGLIVHPPMLYMGYVGFSVAFAFAIAALWSGKLDAAWARWSRPWTNIAWAFLTLGIALGSWWAYYELGWGGWWFWDPVENASLLPWLVGTALIHSLAVTEKRGLFKSWTLLLAIFAFSLSLLGTFLVRSGVLTSVHAFANDPERGVFILLLLAIAVGGSLLLYALRVPKVHTKKGFRPSSRESFLLMNNLLLVTATLTVLLGTLAPLLVDAFGLGKISVGPPYFNFMFVPLSLGLMLLMGIAVFSRWKQTNMSAVATKLWWTLLITALLGLVFSWGFGGRFSLWAVLGVWVSAWVMATTLLDLFGKIQKKKGGVFASFAALNRSYKGMLCAHLGVAMTALGVAMVAEFASEQDVRMAPGQRVEVGQYQVEFLGTQPFRGPNYVADRGHVRLYKHQQLVSELFPEKRQYRVRGSVMTEADIDAGLFQDIYVSLGEPLAEDAWAVRIHVKPMVRWLWLGALFMALGGVLAILDPRYLHAVATNMRTSAPTQGEKQRAAETSGNFNPEVLS